MTYLVTGALGALGAWVVRSLLDREQEVVTYDLGGSDHRLRLALTDDELEALRAIDGDVTDLDALERVMDEHDVTNVIHLAALQVPFVRDDPVLGSRVNVTGTVNVLEAVRRRGERMGPVVYASSIAAVKADAEYPSTLYGVFKLANEGTAAGYFADFGVASVGLRPHTIYGPGRDQGLTSAPTAAMVAAAARRGVRDPVRRLAAAAVHGRRRRGVRARERGARRRARRCTTSTGRWRAWRRSSRRSRRRSRRRGADHVRRGPAAVPAGGGLELVHRARRRADVAAARRRAWPRRSSAFREA